MDEDTAVHMPIKMAEQLQPDLLPRLRHSLLWWKCPASGHFISAIKSDEGQISCPNPGGQSGDRGSIPPEAAIQKAASS